MSLPDDSTTMLPDGWLDKSERVHTSQMPWGFTRHEFYNFIIIFNHFIIIILTVRIIVIILRDV